MEAKDSAKKLFERIRTINRYSGEDQAVKLLMKEIIEEIKKNPNPQYWERIQKEIDKL